MRGIEKGILRALDLAMLPLAALYAGLGALFWSKQKYWPRSRRLMHRLGAFVGRYHYYVPAVRDGDLYRDPAMPRLLSAIDWNHAGQVALLDNFRYGDELLQLPRKGRTGECFYYENGAFAAGDAEILYSFIRYLRPRRMIEIGSGNSTLLTLVALQRNKEDDPSYNCDFRCVEPYAHSWLERTGVRIERSRVELLGVDYFSRLEAGDILFIDSSHVVRAQNDVVFEYLELLPSLKSGVYIHVHDIFSPRDYPRDWLVELNYQWGEQYVVEAFLSYNTEFEIVCACNYLAHEEPELFASACPVYGLERKASPGSFWLRRR
jgi:hypothetical protein